MAVICNYRGVRVFTGDKYVVIVFDYFGTLITSNHVNILSTLRYDVLMFLEAVANSVLTGISMVTEPAPKL